MISPVTERVIKKNGPAYRQLLKEGIVATEKPKFKPESKYSPHTHESGPFCGKLAGSSKNTSYPVDSSGRAKSAIARSGNIATHGGDPDIIKRCSCNMARHNHWFECHKADEEDPEEKYIPLYADGTPAW